MNTFAYWSSYIIRTDQHQPIEIMSTVTGGCIFFKVAVALRPTLLFSLEYRMCTPSF